MFTILDVRSIFILSSILDLILGGQNSSKRQTVFFLLVDLMDKSYKDIDVIDLEAPRLAQYMQKAWKRHQNEVYWVDINLALRKGLKFYQTRSNAIILCETLPACCISKVVRMETGEAFYEKVDASHRLPPKISLKDLMKVLVSEVVRQPERERSCSAIQRVPNQANQIQTQIMIERESQLFALIEERTVLMKTKHVFCEEAVKHDRTGKPVCRDANDERSR